MGSDVKEMEQQIQLVDIEGELKRLTAEEKGKKRTRACFFNLVIYTQKNETQAHYSHLVDSVLAKFPCRVFFISEGPANQSYLRSSVTAQSLNEGIFCEVIQIDVAGQLLERVPFLMLPYIIPDLPLYLLWTQDPTKEKTLLPALKPFAKRVIFDLEEGADLQKTSLNILSLMKGCSHEVGDLQWCALKGWRKVLASTFDTPENLEILQESKTILMTYHQKNVRQTAYFQAWLASVLGWKFKSIEQTSGKTSLSYSGLKNDVLVQLIANESPTQDTQPVGSLLSVEIESIKKKAHVVFRRKCGSKQVFLQYEDEDHCDLPKCLFLGGMNEGQEIIEEIFYAGSLKPYGKMLETLSQISWSHK